MVQGCCDEGTVDWSQPMVEGALVEEDGALCYHARQESSVLRAASWDCPEMGTIVGGP